MSALIPYASSELAPSAMDLGISIGKHLGAAALRKGTEWAKKERPAKARSSYKAKQRKNSARNMDRVGDPVGTSSAKWDTLNIGYTDMTPETLQQLALLNITKFGGSTAYDRRLHDQLNFRGIKVCMNFRAEGALGTAKAMMNVAVISPRSDVTSASILPPSDFFRNPTGSDRGIDFGDAALQSLDYYCSAINTDNYTVHKRMKFMIGPSSSSEGHKEKFIDFYVPLKRQIRYESGSQFPEGRNLYLVWWFNASDGGTPLNSVRFSYRVTRYFKETVGL